MCSSDLVRASLKDRRGNPWGHVFLSLLIEAPENIDYPHVFLYLKGFLDFFTTDLTESILVIFVDVNILPIDLLKVLLAKLFAKDVLEPSHVPRWYEGQVCHDRACFLSITFMQPVLSLELHEKRRLFKSTLVFNVHVLRKVLRKFWLLPSWRNSTLSPRTCL